MVIEIFRLSSTGSYTLHQIMPQQSLRLFYEVVRRITAARKAVIQGVLGKIGTQGSRRIHFIE